MPMSPTAPALFSTITVWPNFLPSSAASNRPSRSFGPPGGNGTMMVMVRSGQAAWARSPTTAASRKQQIKSARRNIIILLIEFMGIERQLHRLLALGRQIERLGQHQVTVRFLD